MLYAGVLPIWAGVVITMATIAVAITAIVHFLFYILFPFLNKRFGTDIPVFKRKRLKSKSKKGTGFSGGGNKKGKTVSVLNRKKADAPPNSFKKKTISVKEEIFSCDYAADVPTVRLDQFKKGRTEKLTVAKINEQARKAGIEKGTGTDVIDNR